MQTINNNRYIKRPLAIGTLFYIMGLIGGKLQDLQRFSLFFLVIMSLLVGMGYYYKAYFPGFYLVVFVMAAMSIGANPILRDSKMFASHANAHIQIQGRIVEVKEYPYQTQYIIQPIESVIADAKTKLSSQIQLNVTKEFETARQGDIITVSGTIKPLSFTRNPGGFNERNYLLIRRVSSKVKVKEFSIDKGGTQSSFLLKIAHYYHKMFEQLMPWDQAQTMKAMLVGDKTLLSPDLQNLYKDVGIAHVLAISGLHISVIASVLWWLFKKLKLHQYLQIIMVMVILWLYAGVTGFSISITRAVIMMTVVLMGKLLDEKSDPVTAWAFSALVLLIYNNLYLWDIGFQLSFVAVGSLILLTPSFNKIYVIPKKIRQYIAPLLAVTVGTTPLLAYYFYMISPIAMVMNLLLVPLVTLLVMIGFLAMLIFPIQPLIAQWVIGSSYYLLLLITYSSKTALKLPFSTLIVGQPTLLEMGIYGLFWGGIIYYLLLSLEDRKLVKKYIISYAFTLIIIGVIGRVKPGNLEVTFLDVGQGDSIVVTTPFHKTFIIDGGDTASGKKIEQFLKYKGIRKIDGMILTHAHTDHMNGLKELAELYQVERVFLTETPFSEPAFKAFSQVIYDKDIPVNLIQAGDLMKHRDVVIRCMYPFKDSVGVSGNQASAVLVLTYGKVSYYFTGDIESPDEEELACLLHKNQVNILKVPHHGSKTSSSQELLSQIMPDVGIISCGNNNRHGHPHDEVVLRYTQNNIPLMVTKDSGAVVIVSNGEGVKLYTMEDKEMLWD